MRLKHFFLAAMLLLQGCASHLSLQNDGIHLYQAGNFAAAETALNQSVEKAMPKGDFRESKDAVCLLLNRATTRFADHEIDGAIADFKLALDAIDYYSQTSTADAAAQLLIHDSSAAYEGDDFEQLLARVYFALALIHQGDFSNAGALLRQAEEWQQAKAQSYRKSKITENIHLPINSFAKYLFALTLEKRGDYSNAEILYHQAASLNEAFGAPENIDTDSATVFIVCHNGNIPQKYSTTSDASRVSMLALEMLLHSSGTSPLAVSSLTGIPVPDYWQPPYSLPVSIKAEIDNTCSRLMTVYDVASAARDELQQKLPIIAARGAARLLMRRAAVGYMQKQDPMLGAIADIGMLIANSASFADTRSWGTLPSSIDVQRFEVRAGTHHLKLHLPSNTHNATLNLPPRSLCVINVFLLHPGIAHVLIPEQFHKK